MRALGHAVRYRMFSELQEAPASASALARRLGIRQGSARFHLNVLVRAGIARPAGAVVRRGGRELLYAVAAVGVELTWRPAPPPGVRAAVNRALAAELARRLDEAAAQPPERDRHVFSAMPHLALTPAAADTARGVLDRTMRELRAMETPGAAEAERYSLAVALFPAPPVPGAQPADGSGG